MSSPFRYIKDVWEFYEAVGEIADALRGLGCTGEAERIVEAREQGATGLEIVGGIRAALNAIRPNVSTRAPTLIAKIERCIRFADYVCDDAEREG